MLCRIDFDPKLVGQTLPSIVLIWHEIQIVWTDNDTLVRLLRHIKVPSKLCWSIRRFRLSTTITHPSHYSLAQNGLWLSTTLSTHEFKTFALDVPRLAAKHSNSRHREVVKARIGQEPLNRNPLELCLTWSPAPTSSLSLSLWTPWAMSWLCSSTAIRTFRVRWSKPCIRRCPGKTICYGFVNTDNWVSCLYCQGPNNPPSNQKQVFRLP